MRFARPESVWRWFESSGGRRDLELLPVYLSALWVGFRLGPNNRPRYCPNGYSAEWVGPLFLGGINVVLEGFYNLSRSDRRPS